MIKFSVVLPVKDNDGKSIVDCVVEIKQQVMHMAGGLSSTQMVGSWVNEIGKVYEDTSELVWTYTTEEIVQKLVDLVPSWAELLKQEAICIEVSNAQVEFITPVQAKLDASISK